MATESDNVNSGALGTLLSVGAFATLGIALVVTALVRSEVAQEVESKEVSADRPYRDLLAEQTAKLAAPASYTDRAKGLISLPIERAMELTVEGLRKDPNSATPPPPIGGAGGTAGTAATEAGGTGGGGGNGGASGEGTTNPAPGEAPPGAVGAEPDKAAEDKAAADKEKADKEKADKEKKKAPKPKLVVPAAPAAPAPAPVAPAPAPNGQ